MFRFPVDSDSLKELKEVHKTVAESFDTLREYVEKDKKKEYDTLVMLTLDGGESTLNHLEEVIRFRSQIEESRVQMTHIDEMIQRKYQDVWAHEKAVVMIRGMIKGLEEDIVKWTLHCEEGEFMNQAYYDDCAKDCEVRMIEYQKQLEKAQLACETARKELDFWKTKKIDVLSKLVGF